VLSWNSVRVLPAAILALVAYTYPAVAGTVVYKCVVNGQTTLTDKPCPGAKPDPSSPSQPITVVPSSKEPSAVGKWSGQIQFSEIANGQSVLAAHSVALLSAEFTPDGKVSGASTENGCHLLGVWSAEQGTIQWLDIMLSGCAYGALDRQYHGSLILARASGQLAAQSLGAAFSKDVGKMFDIKGTLHR
jgi:hypothetical protein